MRTRPEPEPGQAALTRGREPDRVVAAVVAKRQFEGGAAQRLPQHLVPHADAKHRLLADDGLGVGHSVRNCRRVALREGRACMGVRCG
jgi:hypothetical protein